MSVYNNRIIPEQHEVWEHRDGSKQVHVVAVYEESSPFATVLVSGATTRRMKLSTLHANYRLVRNADGTPARYLQAGAATRAAMDALRAAGFEPLTERDAAGVHGRIERLPVHRRPDASKVLTVSTGRAPDDWCPLTIVSRYGGWPVADAAVEALRALAGRYGATVRRAGVDDLDERGRRTGFMRHGSAEIEWPIRGPRTS